jgi:hypothetical protein
MHLKANWIISWGLIIEQHNAKGQKLKIKN